MITPTTAANLAEPVGIIYRDAELRILALIAGKLAQGLTLTDWDARQLTELQNIRREVVAILAETNAEAAAAINRALDWAYSGGQLSAVTDLGATMPAGVGLGNPRPEVLAIADDIATGLTSTSPSILRGIDDAYRGIIGQVVASVATGAEGRRGATQRAINAFFANGLKFVPTARGGNWDIATYAEMAVRTGTARAAIQGHVDQMNASGVDLVIVTPGPRACRICDHWARMILSTTGQTGTLTLDKVNEPGTITVTVDATLDDARAAGWGHPNCRCGIRAYLPGVTNPDIIDRPEWDAVGYEAQQQQRGIERNIRGWKQREALAIDPAAKAEARAKVKAWQQAQRDHLAEHDELKRQGEREQIGGRFSGNVGPGRAAPRERVPVPRADPRGRDARTMSNAERIEAALIMFGSNSPEYREALRRWG